MVEVIETSASGCGTRLSGPVYGAKKRGWYWPIEVACQLRFHFSGAGVDWSCCGHAGAQRKSRVRIDNFKRSIQLIYGQAGEKLGIEIGGLLGHDAAVERRVGHLLDRGRLQQKSDLRGARAGLFGGGIQAADVS